MKRVRKQSQICESVGGEATHLAVSIGSFGHSSSCGYSAPSLNSPDRSLRERGSGSGSGAGPGRVASSGGGRFSFSFLKRHWNSGWLGTTSDGSASGRTPTLA